MAQTYRIPPRLLQRVWTPFMDALEEKNRAFMNELDDRLMEASEKAIDSHRAQHSLMLSRRIRMASQQVLQHLRTGLGERLTPDAPGDVAGELELTLMDNEDTEREVALRKVVAGARAAMPREIEALEQLTRDYSLAPAPESAPWHPHALGEAFLEAVEAIPLSGEESLMMLHWFDRDVVRDLQPEMQDLIHGFGEAGLAVPELEPVTRSRNTDAGGPATASGPVAGTAQAAATSDPGTAAPESHWGQFGYVVPAGERGMVPAEGGAMPQGMPGTLAVATMVQNAPSRESLEPFIMDLLQGLFDLILKRDDLNPALREPLADLQLPLVRISLRDSSFFRDKQHPARQMTGQLLNIALRVDPDLDLKDARELPLARLVAEHVERLRGAGLDSADAYHSALQALREDLEQVESEIETEAAEERRAAEHEETRIEVSWQMETTVHQTVETAGRGLPDQARQQLMDAWVPLLTAEETARLETTSEPRGRGDAATAAPMEDSEPGSPRESGDSARSTEAANAGGTADEAPTADTGTSTADDAPEADDGRESPAGLALLEELLQLMREAPDFKSSAPLLARIRGYLDKAPLSAEERARIKSDLVSAHLMAAGRKPTHTEEAKPAAEEEAATGEAPAADSTDSTDTASRSDQASDKGSEQRTREHGRRSEGRSAASPFATAARLPDDDPSLMRDHDDEHVDTADSLESGTWIQFTSPAGTRVTRMKLVWRGTHSGRFLFTDAAGRSKRQHSLQGLAQEFRTGRAQIIPEESLFDHLMEQKLGTEGSAGATG
ncbi:uncharacterized protein DUF1631 [Thioalkalivibrio sp. ALE21]|uniref:DUF1631 family protein n=1 Tax=Thioalkalivibrio sp. ALE21 TaxID=1158175 RepID=UPI000D87FA8E|nr:DUF1631 family protein [Thioalkalivibrio sp. ALE21]PYG02727.1 uncharacterized protein DUF1631 [Thioalkalivibrio sp. ALE21]